MEARAVYAIKNGHRTIVGVQAANRVAAFKKACRNDLAQRLGRKPTKAEWARAWREARAFLEVQSGTE